MANNTVIVINHNHLDWIRRNPRIFVNGLVSRLEQGEMDPHPGHSRWNGDAMPGVQVIASGRSNESLIVSVSGNCGKKIANGDDLATLRALAGRLGYTVRKKSAPRPKVPNVVDADIVDVGVNINPFTGEKSQVSHAVPTKRASKKKKRKQRNNRR